MGIVIEAVPMDSVIPLGFGEVPSRGSVFVGFGRNVFEVNPFRRGDGSEVRKFPSHGNVGIPPTPVCSDRKEMVPKRKIPPVHIL